MGRKEFYFPTGLPIHDEKRTFGLLRPINWYRNRVALVHIIEWTQDLQ